MAREKDNRDDMNQNPWVHSKGLRPKKVKTPSVIRGSKKYKHKVTPITTSTNKLDKIDVKTPKHLQIPRNRTRKIVLHLVQSMRHFKNHACFEDTDTIENHYILPRQPSVITGLVSGSDLIKSSNKTYATVTAKGYINQPQIYAKMINKLKPDVILCSTVPPMEHRKIVFSRPTYYNHHGFITLDGVNKCCGKDAPYRKTMRRNWQGFTKYIGIGQNWQRLITEGVHQPTKLETLGLTQLDYLLTLDLEESKDKILKYYRTKGPSILFAGFQGYGPEYLVILKTLVKYAKTKGARIFIKPRGQMAEQTQALGVRLTQKEVYEALALQKDKAVDMIPTGVPIYNFLFADAIVAQHSGSIIIESMITGANVLETQPLKRNDFLRLTKFPAIPRADTLSKMNAWLDKVLSPGYRRNPNEEAQRQKFISYHTSCGIPEPNTCEKISELIFNAPR